MKAIPLIALQNLSGVGPKTALKHAEGIPDEFHEFKDYVDKFLSPRGKKSPHDAQGAWERAYRIMDRCEELDIHPVSCMDRDRYPDKFREMQNDKPPVIYIKGSLDAAHSSPPSIAVVGTRKPTEHGERSSYELGRIAAKNQITVVSGLAYGCDYQGHRGCLDYNGTTVAVMAHGLHMVYPEEHRGLADEIADQGGALLSEYPPGEEPKKWYFVARDRLQSALSDVVIVVQTTVNGGACHTAEFGQKQGRKVLCVKPKEEEEKHPSVRGLYSLMKQVQSADWIKDVEHLTSFMHGLNGDFRTGPQLELIP